MSLRFSIGIGSLEEENLILLTGLKETLKPKRERIFEILKETNILPRSVRYADTIWNHIAM